MRFRMKNRVEVRSMSVRQYCVIICYLLAVAAPAVARDHTLDTQVLAEINLARTAPRTYAGFLREFRRQFRDNHYVLPDGSTRIQTGEGVSAVDEAIRFLCRVKPLAPLVWSEGLAAAAAELAAEQESSGATGHAGRRGHGMRERIERYGTWERTIGENIGYGPEGARNMVMQLIIDDGVADRGHRINTFNTDFKAAGVACRPHPRFGSMCVIDFAGGFKGGTGVSPLNREN
jgi:uncharacterized protein YkwD